VSSFLCRSKRLGQSKARIPTGKRPQYSQALKFPVNVIPHGRKPVGLSSVGHYDVVGGGGSSSSGCDELRWGIDVGARGRIGHLDVGRGSVVGGSGVVTLDHDDECNSDKLSHGLKAFGTVIRAESQYHASFECIKTASF
jgi:hypothetical protein